MRYSEKDAVVKQSVQEDEGEIYIDIAPSTPTQPVSYIEQEAQITPDAQSVDEIEAAVISDAEKDEINNEIM
jgi:hypothetical protein